MTRTILVRNKRSMRQESVPLTSIRGFAALWVTSLHYQLGMADVGYQLWPGVSHYGYAGVDIFFILSGFILSAVYRGFAWHNLGSFFIRRGFRVYPMHLAVTGGMLLLWIDAYLRFGVHNEAQNLHWLPAFALLLQPFIYHRLMWNAVTWSISVELVCYLLFPLAILALRGARLWVLLPIILVLAVIEHHLQIYDLYVWGDGAVARGLVGFGLGMAIRLASQRVPVPARSLTILGELVGLGGIIGACVIGQGTYVPIFAGLLILCISYDKGIVSWVLHAPVCLWLGKISFSYYLIHEEIIGLAWTRFPATRLPFSHDTDGFVWIAGVIAAGLVLSTVTWLVIEEPFRKLGGHIARWLERHQARRAEHLRNAPVDSGGGAGRMPAEVREGVAAG
ncbi:acyltransferase family protein [Acidisoma silvae]|uniref:Acyltransferase n=1 Tax=Acidisoma silvae TaxID=2802396 RepID=A0A963YN38_9PROT|nr:acyltransferase [Acidisoma silvae]MCB8873549.1 acyltransferase [Acidisoma silvae]